MNTLHQAEFPAQVFLIREMIPSPIKDELKCPGCEYEYPNESIKKHLCPIFDKIKCKKCQFEFPKKAMKRHIFTYYKCKQYYEQNGSEKKELNNILRERNLADLDEVPQPIHCLCIKNVGKCCSCDM